MNGSKVEVVLDVRGARQDLQGPMQFVQLWGKLEPALYGRSLRPGEIFELGESKEDSYKLEIIRVVPDGAVCSPDTAFAIRDVVDQPRLIHACGACKESGQSRYGPFLCSHGHGGDRRYRLCEDHVVLLDGSLQAFCSDHVPACDCGDLAVGVCAAGCAKPMCCDRHLIAHSSSPELRFCRDCHDRLFPSCHVSKCEGVGEIVCLHVDRATGKVCDQKFCSAHGRRWQVFGPHKIGLGRCPEHSRTRGQQEAALVEQIVLGTAVMRARVPHWRQRLVRVPSPRAIGHIVLKSRGSKCGLDEVERIVADVRQSIDPKSRFGRHVETAFGGWANDVDRARQRESQLQEKGGVLFRQVVEFYRGEGLSDVADQLRFSAYVEPKDKQPLLFVYPPEDLLGLFFGTAGQRIKAISARLGVFVRVEGKR